jgi:hypothetical protein
MHYETYIRVIQSLLGTLVAEPDSSGCWIKARNDANQQWKLQINVIFLVRSD